MYQLSVELLEYLAERLNIGSTKPNFEIGIFRKDQEGSFEKSPFIMKNPMSISVDRRYNMAADELKITFSNQNGELSPDYSIHKSYDQVKDLPISGYKNVILPYNKIYVDLGYGQELRRLFTGQIQGISINECPPTITIDCKNEYRKLLKPIDPINKKVLLYEEEDAFKIIQDLLERAGVQSYIFDMDTIEGNSFNMTVEFELGTQYSDAIKQILETMGHRIFADRFGNIQIRKREFYNQKDTHVIEFNDYVNMTSGEYIIDPSVLRNRVIVQSKNGWQAFEDSFLKKYCNNEVISSGLEAPWAETEEQKWAVADRYFLEMRRKLRRLSVAVKGNPSLDIGDLVQLKALISTANSKYMITSIQSNFTESGYIDIVDLEFVSDTTGHLCEKAEGKYEEVANSTSSTTNVPVTATKRDLIVEYALSFQGVPYQWGGDSAHNTRHYGMDCSHFTWAVYKKFGLMSGYNVSRDQYKCCSPISESALQKGDLVFYGSSSSSSSIYHVGIYIGNGKVISASGGGPSTTSLAKARAQNAKVKTHNLKYMKSHYFYGKPNGL